MPHSNQARIGFIGIQQDKTGGKSQQAPWWRRPEIIGERKIRFVQSHGGIPHQGMEQITIYWPHIMPNLNSRGPKNRIYKQQCEEG